MMTLDSRNLNSLWATVMVETFVREGLKYAVVSPGSRSTPLTMALAAHPAIDAVPVVDERSAAFFGLGLARRTRQPVLLLCTSGSAGAHYLPAMIEASETDVPLIAVTADRPPEMRECNSGQTIDQHRLLGKYAHWYHELAVPELTDLGFRYLRQLTRQAWSRARHGGPVHLNVPLRDPLPPVGDGGAAAEFARRLDASFFDAPETPQITPAKLTLKQRITTTRGLIIAGPAMPANPEAYAEHLVGLSMATGWPILADALSPLRNRVPAGAPVIAGYDIILRNESLARDLTPRYIVALEGWPTSKVLRSWLEHSQAEIVMISEHDGSRDAVHGRTREVTASPLAIRVEGNAKGRGDYANAWMMADQSVQKGLAAWMSSPDAETFEGRVAFDLCAQLPDNVNLVVASSMPVRDLEYFWPTTNRGIGIFSSRGANGIDGTLSTALGLAHGSERPTFLLTGDLAFLHDANGLMVAKELHGSLTVILINNAGGGIFEHLPVAKFEPPFERYFGTPQNVDFGKLCDAHAVPHERIERAADLSPRLNQTTAGVRVIEVRTDRKSDAAIRKRLLRNLAKLSG